MTRQKHTQIPFRRMDGQMVTVDEGLERIMTMLRDRGIDTLYSCENSGALDQGYILMPMLSHWRFRRTIRGTEFSRNLHEYGDHSVELGSFREKGTRRITASFHRAQTAYEVKHSISVRYGFRTCLRWPVEHTAKLQSALEVRLTSED